MDIVKRSDGAYEMRWELPSSVVSTATYSCGTTASISSTKGVEILFYDRCEDK